MTESQLELGKKLKADHSLVYDQMRSMKENINQCSRKSFSTDNAKENYEEFKQNLLNQCDAFVESERKRIDKEFAKI